MGDERQGSRRPRGGPRDDAATRIEARSRELAEQATRGAIRLLARMREELEDIWVEARERRGPR